MDSQEEVLSCHECGSTTGDWMALSHLRVGIAFTLCSDTCLIEIASKVFAEGIEQAMAKAAAPRRRWWQWGR